MKLLNLKLSVIITITLYVNVINSQINHVYSYDNYEDYWVVLSVKNVYSDNDIKEVVYQFVQGKYNYKTKQYYVDRTGEIIEYINNDDNRKDHFRFRVNDEVNFDDIKGNFNRWRINITDEETSFDQEVYRLDYSFTNFKDGEIKVYEFNNSLYSPCNTLLLKSDKRKEKCLEKHEPRSKIITEVNYKSKFDPILRTRLLYYSIGMFVSASKDIDHVAFGYPNVLHNSIYNNKDFSIELIPNSMFFVHQSNFNVSFINGLLNKEFYVDDTVDLSMINAIKKYNNTAKLKKNTGIILGSAYLTYKVFSEDNETPSYQKQSTSSKETTSNSTYQSKNSSKQDMSSSKTSTSNKTYPQTAEKQPKYIIEFEIGEWEDASLWDAPVYTDRINITGKLFKDGYYDTSHSVWIKVESNEHASKPYHVVDVFIEKFSNISQAQNYAQQEITRILNKLKNR